jgi:hypothetical protein
MGQPSLPPLIDLIDAAADVTDDSVEQRRLVGHCGADVSEPAGRRLAQALNGFERETNEASRLLELDGHSLVHTFFERLHVFREFRARHYVADGTSSFALRATADKSSPSKSAERFPRVGHSARRVPGSNCAIGGKFVTRAQNR